MRSNIQVLEQLMIEVVDACIKHGITLFAITKDAEKLIDGKLRKKQAVAADIGVFAHDYMTLKKALSGIEDRGCEDFENNMHMPGNYMMYVDLGTSYHSVTEPGTSIYNGIHLNIYPIIRRPGKTAGDKLLNLTERLIESNERKKISNTGYKYRIKKAATSAYLGLFSATFGGKRMMRKLLSRSDKSKGKYTFHMPNRKIFSFSEKEIRQFPCEFHMGLPVITFPEDSEVYDYYYGRRKLFNTYAVFSANMPWNEFVKYSRVDDKHDNQQILKAIRHRNRNYFPALMGISSFWRILQCSYERFQYFDEYDEERAENMELYREGNFEELNRSINKYVRRIQYYANNDLGFSFDPDYLEMTLAVLKWQEKEKEIKKILDLMRIEYVEPVDEFEKREASGEPFDRQKWERRLNEIKSKIDDLDIDEYVLKPVTRRAAKIEIPLYQKKAEDEGYEIILVVRNKGCDPECRRTIGDIHLDCEKDPDFILDDNIEYNYVHFHIRSHAVESEIWKDTLEYYIERMHINEKRRYVSENYARSFFDKLVLCHL